eukprot:c8284_g1_i1 orf=3-191(-)
MLGYPLAKKCELLVVFTDHNHVAGIGLVILPPSSHFACCMNGLQCVKYYCCQGAVLVCLFPIS